MLTGSVIACSTPVVLEVPVAKLSFLAGFGAGYVLGSRAGKERYEQIRQLAAQAARRLEKYGEDGTLASWIEGATKRPDPGARRR